jgi:hypothetical protein
MRAEEDDPVQVEGFNLVLEVSPARVVEILF